MEKRDLYDGNRRMTGELIEKGQKVPKGKYYITVVVWIQNSKGEFLIQKTASSKSHMWATTGGHPKAGESSLDGIITEIREELGLEVPKDKLRLFKTIKTDDDFVDVYYLNMDIDIREIIVQKDEVEKVKWASVKKIKRLIKMGLFLPSHIEFFQWCLDYLTNEQDVTERIKR